MRVIYCTSKITVCLKLSQSVYKAILKRTILRSYDKTYKKIQMKNVTRTFKNLGLLAAILAVCYSCSDDGDTNEEVTLTNTELKTILEADDVSGVVDTALYDLYMNNSSSAKTISSEECYYATYTETGYTATFNNCVLNGTDDVNGTLTVTYNFESESSSFTATYADFYVGEIKINGTRTYDIGTNSENNAVSFTTTSDMNIVMEDGTVISENGTKTFTLSFGDSLETTTFGIDGNWTVIDDGTTYNVTVSSTLEGNYACSYLNNGTMTIAKNGLSLIVDFGDGTCDDIATITYPNGAVEEITLRE